MAEESKSKYNDYIFHLLQDNHKYKYHEQYYRHLLYDHVGLKYNYMA